MIFVVLAFLACTGLLCAFAVMVRDEPSQGIGSARPSWYTWSTDGKEL